MNTARLLFLKIQNSKKKSDADQSETSEPQPLELDVTVELFDLNNMSQLKNYLNKYIVLDIYL